MICTPECYEVVEAGRGTDDGHRETVTALLAELGDAGVSVMRHR